MTSRWNRSEGASIAEPKNNYLVKFNGEIFNVTMTEKQATAALEALKNIEIWRCIKIEQKK